MTRLLPAFCVALFACEAAPPRILEVDTPLDSRDPTGPYRVTALTRGVVERVEIEYEIGDGEDPLRLKMSRIGDGRWSGDIPGQPPGARVRWSLRATGGGGEARSPGSGTFRFVIRDESGACLVDGDCLQGEICDRRENRCKAPPETCQTDGDCPQDTLCPGPGELCRFRPSRCEDDAACGPGLVCETGFCVSRPECQVDAECGPGGTCIVPPGRCAGRDECARDDQCPVDRPVCRSGRCQAGASTCPDVPCEADDICRGGVCLPAAASCAGGRCEPGFVCLETEGRCVACTADGHCPPDQHCEAGAWACAPEPRGAPCAPCGPERRCGAGLVCAPDYFYVCLPRCGPGGACPDGLECDGERCAPFEFCAGFECERDEDCPSRSCQAGVCDTPQPCGSDEDCTRDRSCREGMCAPRGGICFSGTDCPGGEVCVGGRCAPGRPAGVCEACDEAADCGSPSLCGDAGTGRQQCYALCGPDGCPGGLECIDIGRGMALCLDPFTGMCSDEPVECEDDRLEQNDGPEQATRIGNGAEIYGVACQSDEDWFSLGLRPDESGEVRILAPAPGLEWTLVIGGEPVEGGAVDGEAIVNVRYDDRGVLLGLVCRNCSSRYDLFTRFIRGEDNQCIDDGFEPNDARGQPTRLPVPTDLGGLVVCEGRDDWYVFDKPRRGALAIQVEFDPGLGDIDLELYGPGFREHSSSRGVGAVEAVRISGNDDPGEYHLRVYVFTRGATTNPYRLTIR